MNKNLKKLADSCKTMKELIAKCNKKQLENLLNFCCNSGKFHMYGGDYELSRKYIIAIAMINRKIANLQR